MNDINRLLAAAATSVALVAAPDAFAECPRNCGTVVELKSVNRDGEATGLGAVLGGVAGGVVGHQVGSGRGNDVATVAGAVGGAYAGHQIEKKQKAGTRYQVIVRLDNGAMRTFTYSVPTAYKVGDKVKLAGKQQLTRQ